MVSKSESSSALRETLSSLMDGEMSADGARAPCSRWRGDAEAREAWHTYHLIGDVLRSDDLASQPRRDEDFLGRLRGRLADEPVPMAPLPASARPQASVVAPVAAAAVVAVQSRRSVARRFAPMAMAAGVVAVAGVVGVMRAAGPSVGGPEVGLMAASFDASGGKSAAAGAVVPMTMVRDPQLDRYIAAHRKLANGMAAPDRTGAPVPVVYEAR